MGQIEYRSVVVPTLKWLNSLEGCKAINIHGDVYMEKGTPDIIGCYKGRMFTMEAKSDIGKPEPLQLVRLTQWKMAGAKVGIIRSLQDAQDMISQI